ncbi:MAG: hypothetical protein ABIH41_02205 [Nanoarchaeota archaeon]
MHWIAISGSWRRTNAAVEQDVRQSVRDIMALMDGIITGGALGADYFATDEAMLIDAHAERIRVHLPTPLPIYAAHLYARANEGAITHSQAEEVIAQLTELQRRNKSALIEHQEKVIDKKSYFDRNTDIVNAADALYAFQVNNSEGVQDTITKAQQKGIPVHIHTYTIQ